MAKSETVWPGADALEETAKPKEVGAAVFRGTLQKCSASSEGPCEFQCSAPRYSGPGSVSRLRCGIGAHGLAVGQHWRLNGARVSASGLSVLCLDERSEEYYARGSYSSYLP